MVCSCICHPRIEMNCWCPQCMDNHIDFNKVISQMDECERCGDLIGRGNGDGMKNHLEWCMVDTTTAGGSK